MTEPKDLLKNWEEAYLRQLPDAVVGRLFRGIVHNLNGIIQAFAMQSGLFALMFDQADKDLQEIVNAAEPPVRERASNLRRLFATRAALIPAMDEKITASQRILSRANNLCEMRRGDGALSVNELVAVELEFLNGNKFFKHKIKKNIHFDESLPPLRKEKAVVQAAIFELLVNAMDAVEQTENPRITVATSRIGDMVEIAVEDPGPGVAFEARNRIFEPFFTTKENRCGLGLYLAERVTKQCGGSVTFRSDPGSTRFVIAIPADDVEKIIP